MSFLPLARSWRLPLLLVVPAAAQARLPADDALPTDGDRAALLPEPASSIAQQAYLKASNPELNDFFGWSVAISGDTLVVGAEREDSGASGVDGDDGDNSVVDSGAAYVFVRAGATWSQQAYLKASNPGAFDRFGRAVAISGDTVVVGAPYEDSDGVNGQQNNGFAPDSGAAYVFVRNGTTWSQQAYLKASNAASPPFPGDEFGGAVAISGDTVIVGAIRDDSSATGVNGNPFDNGAPLSGAAFVFVRNGTTWSQEAYLKASNTGAGDLFGDSVAISGETVVVGAPNEESNATGIGGDQGNNALQAAGAAYVFVRSGSTWTQEAYVKPSLLQPLGGFGDSVSASEDTILVGVRQGTIAAEVFVRDTGWSFQARLEPGVVSSMTCVGSPLLSSVGLSGDLAVVADNGDSSDATGINGAHNTLSPCSGAAYLFRRSGAVWTEEAYLKASNAELIDHFGTSAAVSEGTLVVGAYHEDSAAAGVGGNQNDNGAQASGAAYAFQTCSPPAVAFRNAGSNPASYAAGPITIGGTFSATVDNGLAGQTTSILIAFDTPITITLGGGQVLLCLDLGGSGEQFTGAGLFPSASAGGVDSYTLPFANDPATCGVVYCSQAVQFGNPPFVLSNAQDLTIGSL